MRQLFQLQASYDVRFEADNDHAAHRIAKAVTDQQTRAAYKAAEVRRVLVPDYTLEELGLHKKRLVGSATATTNLRELGGVLLVGWSGVFVFWGVAELNLPVFLAGWLILYTRLRREARTKPADDS